MKHLLPLYSFFNSLKKHDFYLGIDEYKALIEVLEQDKDNIYFQNPTKMLGLCRLLWFKPNQNAFLFERLFEQSFEYLKEELAEEKRQYDISETTEKTDLEKDTEAKTEEDIDDNSQNPTDLTPPPTDEVKPENKPLEGKEPNEDFSTTKNDSEQPLYLNFVEGQSQENGLGGQQDYKKHFEFVKNYVAVSNCQLTQQWRFLKKKGIETYQKQEIDIKKTVEKTAQNGYLFTPVFQTKVKNSFRLLTFIDHRGSMIAFRHLAETLANSARKAAGTQNQIYYFRNVPQRYLAGEEKNEIYVYKEKGNTFPISLKKILAQQQFDAILIISDAGTAKGNFNIDRIEATEYFLRELYAHSLKVAWLNPMPQDRWDGSAAYIICELVDMFEANHEGLRQAISIFRGKKKVQSAILSL